MGGICFLNMGDLQIEKRMSAGRKVPLAQAIAVAQEVFGYLAPHCERIEIVGSVRRKNPMVGDVELLFIPKLDFDLFGEPTARSKCETQIESLVLRGILSKRLNVNGSPTWGNQNKLARHVATGIGIDLFATTEANWWNSLVIRTGPASLNVQLCTGAQQRGLSLNAYGAGFTDRDGCQVLTKSEREVFEIAGVKYRKPEDRDYAKKVC